MVAVLTGCNDQYSQNPIILFENCTCVTSCQMEQGGDVSVEGSARDGQCEDGCTMWEWYTGPGHGCHCSTSGSVPDLRAAHT